MSTKSWKDKEEFKDRVLDWAGRLDVKVRSLAVRPMSNKWASCSTSGNLNFNEELLSMDRKVGEYVIVHELLHFSVPHHGKLWKSLVRAHLGDYDKLDQKLKRFVYRTGS
jgi:predicted metal-dependent hydrolase